jgi:hypothetical protein
MATKKTSKAKASRKVTRKPKVEQPEVEGHRKVSRPVPQPEVEGHKLITQKTGPTPRPVQQKQP